MNVRFRWLLAVLLALCLGVPSSGWASSDIKKIVLATDTIDGLVEKDGSGLYVDMLTKIFAAQSIELNIMIVPQSRAYRWTANGNADAMLSARQNEVEGLYFPVWHYDITFVSAMFKKDRFKDWQGEYSLQNRSVGTLGALTTIIICMCRLICSRLPSELKALKCLSSIGLISF